MVSAMETLMTDAFATGYYNSLERSRAAPVEEGDEESRSSGALSKHATRIARPASQFLPSPTTSSAIESSPRCWSWGLWFTLSSSAYPSVHQRAHVPSSLWSLPSASILKAWVFEGTGLGGCIVQTKFKSKATAIMTVLLTHNSSGDRNWEWDIIHLQ